MLCAKFGWNWPCDSCEHDFLVHQCISLFGFYLPLAMGVALDSKKHEFLSPKDALCQIWLKLALWFLRRRIIKLVNVFLLFLYYLPLEKDVVLHFNKLESPSPKDALCQIWLKLALWFLSRRWKYEKFTDRLTTDNSWSEKLTWAFS